MALFKKKWKTSFELADVTLMSVFAISIVATAMGCGRETRLKSANIGKTTRVAENLIAEKNLPGVHVDSFSPVSTSTPENFGYDWLDDAKYSSSESWKNSLHYQIFLCPSQSQPCNPQAHVDIRCAVLPDSKVACNIQQNGITLTYDANDEVNASLASDPVVYDPVYTDNTTSTTYFQYEDRYKTGFTAGEFAVLRKLPN